MKDIRHASLTEVLNNVDAYLEKYPKRVVCDFLLEHGHLLEPFDNLLEDVFRVLGNFCGRVYVARLKQALKTRLLASKNPITPELISAYGTKVAYILNSVLDPRLGLDAIERNIDKFFEELPSRSQPSISLDIPWNINKNLQKAIVVSGKLIALLDELGILLDRRFGSLYGVALSGVIPRLDSPKALLAFRPILYSLFIDIDTLEKLFVETGRSFDSIKGVSYAIGYSLVMSFRENLFLPALSIIFGAIRTSAPDLIRIYELGRSGDIQIVYHIMNLLTAQFFTGSANDVLSDLARGVIKPRFLLEALKAISYASMTVTGLEQILELILFLIERFPDDPRVESGIYELINKILLEVRPSEITKFLASSKTRRIIIKIFESSNSYAILLALAKLINTYVTPETLKSKAESELQPEKLDMKFPYWRDEIPPRALLYLGVGGV